MREEQVRTWSAGEEAHRNPPRISERAEKTEGHVRPAPSRPQRHGSESFPERRASHSADCRSSRHLREHPVWKRLFGRGRGGASEHRVVKVQIRRAFRSESLWAA